MQATAATVQLREQLTEAQQMAEVQKDSVLKQLKEHKEVSEKTGCLVWMYCGTVDAAADADADDDDDDDDDADDDDDDDDDDDCSCGVDMNAKVEIPEAMLKPSAVPRAVPLCGMATPRLGASSCNNIHSNMSWFRWTPI